MTGAYRFAPELYETELRAIFDEVGRLPSLERANLEAVLRRHPKDGRGFFSRSELIRGLRYLLRNGRTSYDASLIADLQMKPVRTMSGVAPVTVLTKPFPCPGRCIFCPSDVRMPKSYLSDEPGAQRAAEHQFDPYRQTLSRLLSLYNTGHPVDKVELILLGGTWSSYPEAYQLWFLKRCFDAMNDFGAGEEEMELPPLEPAVDFRLVDERAGPDRQSYNAVVERFSRRQRLHGVAEEGCWPSLLEAQRINEAGQARCVGLVVETRPDHLSQEEVVRLRALGATKVQIGLQSLDDRVLELNHRGHDVGASRRAMALLRGAGFKIHAHWMPNLYGSSPAADVEDYERLFAEPDFRPDELKIYPCSLIESAELMTYYRRGLWRPYSHEELLDVLVSCLRQTPEYCRLTRVIRDIPGTDIVVGNKVTNLRQVAEAELTRRGGRGRDIRAREVGGEGVDGSALRLRQVEYEASGGREVFLQFVTPADRLAAFLRLRLPSAPSLIPELGGSAIIREVHVYGALVGLGRRDPAKAQHGGLGTRLVRRAAEWAARAGFANLAVISSVGTRAYYRRLGFVDRPLYQHLGLENGA